jgi:hypothetical protein
VTSTEPDKQTPVFVDVTAGSGFTVARTVVVAVQPDVVPVMV